MGVLTRIGLQTVHVFANSRGCLKVFRRHGGLQLVAKLFPHDKYAAKRIHPSRESAGVADALFAKVQECAYTRRKGSVARRAPGALCAAYLPEGCTTLPTPAFVHSSPQSVVSMEERLIELV
jgi:hypothetical protein